MTKTGIYTPSSLAESLHLSTETIYAALRAGELKGHKKARRWFVLHSDLVAWIKAGE